MFECLLLLARALSWSIRDGYARKGTVHERVCIHTTRGQISWSGRQKLSGCPRLCKRIEKKKQHEGGQYDDDNESATVLPTTIPR